MIFEEKLHNFYIIGENIFKKFRTKCDVERGCNTKLKGLTLACEEIYTAKQLQIHFEMVDMSSRQTHRYVRVSEPGDSNCNDNIVKKIAVISNENRIDFRLKLDFLAVEFIEGSKRNIGEYLGSTGLNSFNKFNKARARSDGQLSVSIFINDQLISQIYSNMIRNKGTNIQTKSSIKNIEYTDKEMNIHLVKRLSLYPDEIRLKYANELLFAKYDLSFRNGIYTFPKIESMIQYLTKHNIDLIIDIGGIEIITDIRPEDKQRSNTKRKIQENIESRKMKKLNENQRSATSPIMNYRIIPNFGVETPIKETPIKETPIKETGNSGYESFSSKDIFPNKTFDSDFSFETDQYKELPFEDIIPNKIFDSDFSFETDQYKELPFEDMLENILSLEEDCQYSAMESGQIQPPITCFDNPRYNQQATTSSQYIALEEAEGNI